MQRTKYYTLPLILLLGLMACSEIKDSDRFIEMPTPELKRTILLEDFTGQRCTNCPDAHRAIHELTKQYGDAVIPVAIHAGSFAIMESQSIEGRLVGLGTEEGNQYAEAKQVKAYPSGLVNRQGAPSSYPEWSKAVWQAIQSAPRLDLFLQSEFQEEDSLLTIQTEIRPYASVSGKLQLWLVEDFIEALQLDNNQYFAHYMHNHVFRSSINGTWGEEVQLVENIHKEHAHQVQLNKKGWNPAHMRVVAFIYNDKEGVLQATQTKVKP